MSGGGGTCRRLPGTQGFLRLVDEDGKPFLSRTGCRSPAYMTLLEDYRTGQARLGPASLINLEEPT